MHNQKGNFIKHIPCLNPECGSSDGLAVYEQEDGSFDGYCWSCKTYFKDPLENNYVMEEKKKENKSNINKDFILNNLSSDELGRGISKEVAEKYGIKIAYSEQNREPISHFYPMTKKGKITGYKERKLPKTFYSVGDCKKSELFGQSLFSSNGQLLIICEGEIDTVSAYQMLRKMGRDYRVVGLTNGANLSSIKLNLDYIESFDSVVLFFDQDAVGKKAAIDAAKIISPGKAKIATFDEKDTNDLLTRGKYKEFLKALQSAKEWRPDGIIRLSQSWDELWKDDNVKSIPYPWDGLNHKLYGIRPREITTITSGSGLGKSAVIRELIWSLFNETNDNIGILALEENIGRTSWGLVSMAASRPLHIREEREGVSEEEIRRYFDRSIGTGRFVAYDHFGSTSSDNLLWRLWPP